MAWPASTSGKRPKTNKRKPPFTNGNNAPTAKTLISKIDYNEIGPILNKHLHSTDSIAHMAQE
jgi:hypothetical protein